MSAKPKKPSAAERTVDMFAAPKPVTEAFLEDALEKPKEAETIEQSADRWRDTALYTGEYFSKNWAENMKPGLSKYRITQKEGLMLLERFQVDNSGKATAHWTGVMFHTEDLYELTSVFVKASKEKQANAVSL